MKILEVDCPYGSGEKVVLGYMLEEDGDLFYAISEVKESAGLGCWSTEEIMRDELREFGIRPTTYPVLAVFEYDDTHNYLGVRYIRKEMFDALD